MVRLAVVLGFLTVCVAGSAAGQTLLEVYRSIPSDSADVRRALVTENVKAFRDAFDSLLVAAGPEDPTWAGVFPAAAADYLSAARDSLLLADLAFARSADPAARRAWFEAVLRDSRGSSLQAGGDMEAAALAFRSAAESYRSLGHLRREAVAWGSLGVACWNAGDLVCVEDAYRKALAARRRLGDPLLVGRTLNGMGSLHFRRGDYDSALAYYEDARRIRETLDRPVDLAVTLTYLGHVQYRRGHLDAARRRYLEALDLLGPGGPGGTISDARNGLANVYSTLGDHGAAVRIYREEIAAAEARSDARQAAVLRLNLGQEALTLGQYDQALRDLEAARDTLSSLADTSELARVMNCIGMVYQDQADQARALAAFQEAEQFAVDAENRLVRADALGNLGITYYQMGLFDRAEESYTAALSEYRALGDSLQVSPMLDKLALVRMQRGNGEGALALERRVLEMGEASGLPDRVVEARVNLAYFLDELGRVPEAHAEYRKLTDLAEGLGRSDVLWRGYLGLAHTFERSGGLDSARVYNQRAIEVLEGLRGQGLAEETRAAFLGKWSYVYEAQVHVLAKLHQAAGDKKSAWIEEAFETAERGKARAFLDVLSEGRLGLEESLSPALRARREILERSLSELRYRLRRAETTVPADSMKVWKKQIRDLEAEENVLLERIRLEDPRYASLDAGRPQSLADIQKVLLGKPGTTLLEYSLGDSASYLFALTGSGIRLHRLPPRTAIETEVRRLRSALASPGASGDSALVTSARTLFLQCLAPVRDLLAGTRQAIVVPDGALQFLPFEVLLAEDAPPPPASAMERGPYFAALPFAFEDTEIHYGPSATVLVLLETGSSPSRARSLLAVGDPIFAPEGAPAGGPGTGAGTLPPLPHTRLEVESIAAFFPPTERAVLLGAEARESSIAALGDLGRFRFLHFATHGLVDERRPERSSLALSYPRDASEDGYLQAAEIYRLHLRAELVVLSACETGVGRMVRGEGVLGLPRAFLYAGASSVLVSLWSVSDRSTAELMTEFYRALIREEEPPGQALRSAQKELRAKPEYSHPFYWAPFILIGPPSRGGK